MSETIEHQDKIQYNKLTDFIRRINNLEVQTDHIEDSKLVQSP
jgi:citrate synthase